MAQKTSDFSSDFSFSSDSLEKFKNSPYFNIPYLFNGYTRKGLHDSELLKSPTSPLDHRLFYNRSCSSVRKKSWDYSRVGLSLVDSLAHESMNILLGSRMRTANNIPAPKPSNLSSISGPNSDFSLSDSKSLAPGSVPTLRGEFDSAFFSASLPVSSASIHDFMDSIKLSEDYTCITSQGQNPLTTHIFGDRILHKSCMLDSLGLKKKEQVEGGSFGWIFESLENSPPFSIIDFLSSCYFCKKKLEADEDIYMYRGDKAFCSCYCREQEMLLEEEIEAEKPATDSYDSPSSSFFHEDLFI